MSTELTTAFTTAMTTIKSDILTLMTAVVPGALGIFGVGLALAYGKRFFRSLAS